MEKQKGKQMTYLTMSKIYVTMNTINKVKIHVTNWETILAKYKAQN